MGLEWHSDRDRVLDTLSAVVLAVCVVAFFGYMAWFSSRADEAVEKYSHDGRYHPCDVISEEGVTTNLEAFWERCGRSNP